MDEITRNIALPVKVMKEKIWTHPGTGGEYFEGHPYFEEDTSEIIEKHYCPSCDNYFGRSSIGYYNFCYRCGQKLKWE